MQIHLTIIDDPPVWVDLCHLAMRVHVLRMLGRKEPEALSAAQQDVQVIVVVMMEST